MAIVVHLRANTSRGRPYGHDQTRTFLEQLLPLCSEIPVQVAHMAGTGPGYDDPPADNALSVLAEAVASQDPRTRRLWFDVTTVADPNISEANASLLARRIRQVGVQRVLYGSAAAATYARAKDGRRFAACRSRTGSSPRSPATWRPTSADSGGPPTALSAPGKRCERRR